MNRLNTMQLVSRLTSTVSHSPIATTTTARLSREMTSFPSRPATAARYGISAKWFGSNTIPHISRSSSTLSGMPSERASAIPSSPSCRRHFSTQRQGHPSPQNQMQQQQQQQHHPQEGDVVEDEEFLFFWQPPAWPGQWTTIPFVMDGLTYSCAEQYMMAQKALLFGDREIFQKILESDNPREHKKLGRLVKQFDAKVWEEKCLEIVVAGNLAKFSQHPAYAKRLLATKNKTLVEASPYDPVWGVGMASSHSDIRNPSKWQGKNLLGIALMKVRETLRKQAAAQV